MCVYMFICMCVCVCRLQGLGCCKVHDASWNQKLTQLMSFRKGWLNNSFCIFSKSQSFLDEFVSSMAHEGFVKQEYDHVTIIN